MLTEIHFSRIMSKNSPRLERQFDKEKKPYLYVGLICVRVSGVGIYAQGNGNGVYRWQSVWYPCDPGYRC